MKIVKKMNRNESGYTLIGVLAIFTIASVLAISLVMMSVSTLKASKTEVDNQSVFYIAEAGLNHAVNEIEKRIIDISDDIDNEDALLIELESIFQNVKSNTEQLSFKKVNDVLPRTEIKITKLKESKNKYNIQSQGYIGDQSRKVEQNISISWELNKESDEENGFGNMLKDFSLYSFDKMELRPVSISGNIGTASEQPNRIDIVNGILTNGQIFAPKKDDKIVKGPLGVNHALKPLLPPPLPNFPEFPEFVNKANKPNDTLIQQQAAKNFNLSPLEEWGSTNIQLSNVTFTVNNDEKSLYMENLTMSGSSLEIKGSGTLNIHVDKKLDMTGSKIITNNNKVNIYIGNQLIMSDSKIISSSKPLLIYTNNHIRLTGSEILSHPNYNTIYSKGKIDLEKSNTYSSVYAAQDITAIQGHIYGNFLTGGDINLTETHTRRPEHTTTNGGLLYAPYGKITTNGSDVVGSMFADTIYIDVHNNKSKQKGSVIQSYPNFKGPLSVEELGYSNPSEGNQGGISPPSKGKPNFSTDGNLNEVN